MDSWQELPNLTLNNPIICSSENWSLIGDYLVETYPECAHAQPLTSMFDEIQNYIDQTPPNKRLKRYYITTLAKQKTCFHYTTNPNKKDRIAYFVEILPSGIYLRKGSTRPRYNPILREGYFHVNKIS